MDGRAIVHPHVMEAARLIMDALESLVREVLPDNYYIEGSVHIMHDGVKVGAVEWSDDTWNLVVDVDV